MIQILPVYGIPVISSENELWDILLDKLKNQIQDDDILICAHTPFSRVMGKSYTIEDITPSDDAIRIAEELEKDPRKVEIILQNSKEVIKIGRNVIITRSNADIVCANGGIDESNAGIGKAIALPDDPDQLATLIRDKISQTMNVDIGVIISDTVGRALRRGAVNIGVGCAGIHAMRSDIGKTDLFGFELRVSEIAIIDELASAAELLQGQSNEGMPFVIIRGYDRNFQGRYNAREINRPENERLFK